MNWDQLREWEGSAPSRKGCLMLILLLSATTSAITIGVCVVNYVLGILNN